MANYQSTYTGAYIDGVIGQKRSAGYFPTYSGTSAIGSDSHGIYINSSGIIEASTKSLITQNTTESVGNAYTPIYIDSNGQPVACDIYYTSVNTKPSAPYLAVIKNDGVMEVGQYIDFHNDTETASDYTYRINNSAANELTCQGNLKISGNLYFGTSSQGGYLNGSATNGGMNSILIGDDCWLGDCNNAGIISVKAANSTNSGFFFYSNDGTQVGQLYFGNGSFNLYRGSCRFSGDSVFHFWNMGIGGSYTDSALQITSTLSGGPNGWGGAPRLGFHWGGVNAAQIGCASNGYMYECMGTGTTFYQITTAAGSTKNIKREITNLPDEMGTLIDQLKPVSFIYDRDYDDLIEKEDIEEDIKREELDSYIRYGLLWEDTVDIFPDICKTDEWQHGGKIINYTDLIPILIQEIKSLRKRVAKLENEKMGVEI